jgi:hypothetical protein
MPANVILDPETIQNQVQNYETTVFQTEDGGNSTELTTFHWAGGSSTYAFGLYQYDAARNPLTVPALQALDYSSTQTSELKQHGGLSSTTLNSLDSQLHMLRDLAII